MLPSGESLAVITEAAQYSVPPFRVNVPRQKESFLRQDHIYPLGSRISYSLISKEGVPSLPVPVLCLHKDAQKGAQPLKVSILHNAVGLSVDFDETSKTVHCLWWWNAWTPDYVESSLSPPPPPPPVFSRSSSPPPPGPPADLVTKNLPAPPLTYYAAHSVPDPQSPAWLRSLVPKSNPSVFDQTKPFWVAPIPEGYQFDYFPMGDDDAGSLTIGESKANGTPRLPDTSGARWLQDAIQRGLMFYPGPPAANFGADPAENCPEEDANLTNCRDIWERCGGIVAAGEHIAQASARDKPEFIPVPEVNPYTNEMEPDTLPGVGVQFPETTTWEDHLIIVNALKAHFDHANLVNSTRVLMYARGSILDGAIFKSVPKQLLAYLLGDNDEIVWSFKGPMWPEQEEATTVSTLVLDFPQVVGVFPVTTNYRTLINPDKVWYPWNDYPDIGTVFVDDGFLVDGATSDLFQEAAVDWVMSDPCDPVVEMYDLYRHHLDLVSY
jgi:hypothetical protein